MNGLPKLSYMTMANREALKDFLFEKAHEWKQVALSAELESPETHGTELHFFTGED